MKKILPITLAVEVMKITFARLLIIGCALYFPTSRSADISDAEADRLYRSVVPPETIAQLLKAIWAVAESGVYSRNDFYTTESLKKLFGDQLDAKVRDDGIITTVGIHGFANLVNGSNESTTKMPYLSGVWLEARKPDANGWSVCCRLHAEFWGDFHALDFESVTHVLGPNWKEDKKGESLRLMSRAEPFNPPPQPVTGYMGDSLIIYQAGRASLELEFDKAGQLHSIDTEWPRT